MKKFLLALALFAPMASNADSLYRTSLSILAESLTKYGRCPADSIMQSIAPNLGELAWTDWQNNPEQALSEFNSVLAKKSYHSLSVRLNAEARTVYPYLEVVRNGDKVIARILANPMNFRCETVSTSLHSWESDSNQQMH